MAAIASSREDLPAPEGPVMRSPFHGTAVISDEDGNYGLVEIKLGGAALIDKGVDALNKLASKIDTDRMNPPAFKMVLTAVGDYAYMPKDGIVVCPLGCLCP